MKKLRLVLASLLLVAGVLALFAPLDPSLYPHNWKRREAYPQQLHLSLGETADEMVVTFASLEHTGAAPQVAYGTSRGRYPHVAHGESLHFVEENPAGLQWIHSVKLQGLLPGTKYYYVAKVGNHTSQEFSFLAPATEATDQPMKFLVFGDMGFVGGSTTIDHMAHHEIREDDRPTAAIHLGDMAYHLFDDGGLEGDLYLQKAEAITAKVPYMVCVGNHERGAGDRYRHYIARFRMPGPARENGNMWYSWNVGLIHFVAISTDHIDQRDHEFIARQNKWLIDDLKEANRQRSVRPWIIVYAHHPMYCSNLGEYCRDDAPFVRDTLEDIFQAYGVDAFISAHEHSYERLWPVAKNQILAKHYGDPQSAFQVISGSGGCPLTHGLCFDPTWGSRGLWSAFRWWFPGVFGYDRMVVHNATHLSWEHVLSGAGRVVDRVVLVRTKHGPFSPRFPNAS